MRIVDLYKMSEEERKKALEEQQSLYNERMRQSEEIGRQANQQFNDLISKQGEYDTSKHTTTIGDLRKAYKGSNSFQTVNNSLNNYSKNNSPSIWEKMGYIMNNFGTGVHQGTVGIAQGLFTDSANEMQKGKVKNNNELFNNFINAYAGNDLHHIAQSTLNTINEGINILNDKDKNLWQKMVDINLNTVSNGAKALLPMQGFYSSANQVIGKVSDTDQQLLEMNKNISEPLEERKKELANEGEKYDGATKFLGEAGQVIGNMIPSITASAITKNPSVALGVMGASVKGQATQEALDKGMSLDKATQIGDAKALIEVATEKLSGGTKVFGHGSLDDIAEELVKKGAKSKAGKFIMTQLLNAGGEIAEEEISNVLGNAIDKGTTDPDKKVLDMKEAFETMGSTAFTTTMLNLLTGGMVNDYRKISNNMNQYKDTNTGEILDNNSQDILKQAENIINENSTPNLQQQSTQNEQILPTQQITQEQNNIAQNGNMEQVLPTQNNYKNQAINEINNSYLDNQSKQNLIQEISNIEVNEEGLNQIRQIITEQSKLDTNATYKTDNNRKRTYMQYKNSDVNYDTTALDIALDSVKENRNGKRTVKQWLEVADNLGKQISDKSNSEIEQIAFRSWHDLQPNTKDSITRYDNRNKSNVPFQKFTSDDWVNTIYKAVNETRENSQQNIANSQGQNNVVQNGNINEFNGYTDKEINNIKSNKISIAQSNEDITQFVNNSKKMPGNFKMYLGKIKENASNVIKNTLGINVDNYNISLKTDDVRKIFKDHGSERTEIPRGQIPITEEDFLNIPNIINEPDVISKSGETPQGKPAIKFEKNIDGNNIVVTYVSDKHNNLELQTMYKFKNNKKRDSATALHENQAPGLNTSEMDSGTNLFINNSIPQNNNSVKNNTITNNYTQSNENNTQNAPTKGESINWNGIERPEGKIRKHYRSIIESSNTTAEAKAIAKEMMGLDTYTPQSNESLLQKADSRISTTNPETELKSLLSRVMNNEKVNDVDMAVGERLIEYYSKIGDSEHLQDAIHATALAGTQAGRTVQAMALLNHMTPQGQVVWLERSVNKANKELEQKFKNKKNIPQFELTSDMTEKILNTKSKEEMYKVLDDVYEELGQQVPKTTLEKIDEWRYFSMLANVKTHGRNMIGNLAMNLTQRAKNKVAGAIEGTVAKFNPEMERTHTIVPTSKKVKDFAKNDVKNMDVQTELGMNENKYNPQSRLQSARRTFKSDVLEKTLGKMFDLNSKLLEVEDNIGLKSMYVKSLGEYITANKIDIDNMTDAQLSKARQHAIKEAQEATFHQASALATALNQMGRKNNIAKFALDSAVPFKKTPINVAKTGVQYSPVGLIKSAVYDVGKLRKGDITVNQYIDNISKGLTGTGIAYLGYALAQAGILKASGSDDDKKEKYEEEQGKQSYSIEIGGKTYSLDWLSPVGIPLFIGAEINQQFNTSKKEKNSKSNDDNETLNQIVKSVANIANASANAMNPMSEMSMISGLTSVLSSYNKENAVGDMIVNTGKSYINQFVPTALGQLARTTDDYERTTKSTKTGALEKAVDSTINQIKSKIPGLRQTLPTKTDIWGKDIKQDANLPFRAFNNFINPSKVQDVSTDKVDKELNSLYAKTGESSIIPKAIEKTYTIDGTDYRMTDKEYAKYYQKYGETSYNLINELISSKDYKNLTDEQKQKAIENVYSYAKESNKLDYAKNNNIEVKEKTIYTTMNELKDKGGKQSSYLNYIAKTTGLEKEVDKNKALANSNYDDKTKSIIYANGTGKDDKLYNNIKNSNININQYLSYKIQESEDKFLADKDSNGKSISGTAKEKVYNYVNNNITGYNNKLLILGSKYKLSRSEQEKLANYIYQISTSVEDKNNLFDYYSKNFTINNGKVYYK